MDDPLVYCKFITGGMYCLISKLIMSRSSLYCVFLWIDSVDPEVLLEIASGLSRRDVYVDVLKRLPKALKLELSEDECQEQQRKLGLRGMFLSMFLLWEKKREVGPPADSELTEILKQLGFNESGEKLPR